MSKKVRQELNYWIGRTILYSADLCYIHADNFRLCKYYFVPQKMKFRAKYYCLTVKSDSLVYLRIF